MAKKKVSKNGSANGDNGDNGDTATATAAPKRTRKKKAKETQKYIEGTEPPRIPAIDKAAEEYADLRDERMAILRDEIQAHDKLLELMKEHDLTEYETSREVKVERKFTKEKVKVKRPNDDDD